MQRTSDEHVRAWIAAEQAGRADEADRRFRSVARSIGRLAPPAGLADAVLARLTIAAAARDVWSRWWARTAVATAVLSAGAAGAMITPAGWFRSLLASLHAAALSLGDASAAAWAWVAGAVTVWSGLGRAAAVLGRQLAGPEPMILLAVQFALAAGALAALRRLLPEQEN